MSIDDLERYRPAFETTLALGMAEAGISLGPNPFALDPAGDYENESLGLMWQGYTIGLVHGTESAGAAVAS